MESQRKKWFEGCKILVGFGCSHGIFLRVKKKKLISKFLKNNILMK
jgi:hypothetical protein